MDAKSHAPYLMPDGTRLTTYLNASVPSKRHAKSGKGLPGKHSMWATLQSSKRGGMSDAELAELRTLEQVGHRRRRRWLNERVLRDMAGHLTAEGMEVNGCATPLQIHVPLALASHQAARI